MTDVLSIRLPRRKLAALDNLAAQRGLDRSGLVRDLVDSALQHAPATSRRKFASADLLGSVSSGRGSSNASARAALAKRHEKNR